MAKARTIYTCQSCGAQSPKWMGKCPDCQSWNSYVEETYETPAAGNRTATGLVEASVPVSLPDIQSDLSDHRPIGISELDRVLGGGYVPGSAILIGGDPGIGKSTLLLQMFGRIAEGGKPVLYISGEESAAQIKMRADRLQIREKNIQVVTENCLERILELIKKTKPALVAIDSVQTIYSNNLTSAPGTVSQVRECSGQIIMAAKSSQMACLLVGHVTKEGTLAGPKVLEHMVDCVLYFEGERGHSFRILRVIKNRFGATNEIGVFEMTGAGLQEVANPSSLFLSERPQGASGSAVVASLEGTRPVLLEVQALVSHSGLANPRRTAIGFDHNRLSLLVAVLEKVVGVQLFDQDIFLNIAGGLKVSEPALDLGTSIAIFSSFRNRAIDPHSIMIGEVGLTGEVRSVARLETRLKEAAKLGFKKAIIPQGKLGEKPEGIICTPVKTLEECLQQLF